MVLPTGALPRLDVEGEGHVGASTRGGTPLSGTHPCVRLERPATAVDTDAERRGVGDDVWGEGAFSRGTGDPVALVDVRLVLDEALRMARPEVAGRARFVRQYGDVPLVSANEASLGDVFYNLVLNAAGAVPHDSVKPTEIRIVTRTDDSGRAIVELKANGARIAPQILRRMFDPLFSTTPPSSARNLGRSVGPSSITSLGGELGVEVERDQGSVFRVALPAARIPRAAGSDSHR